jgi:hypothetical protein
MGAPSESRKRFVFVCLCSFESRGRSVETVSSIVWIPTSGGTATAVRKEATGEDRADRGEPELPKIQEMRNPHDLLSKSDPNR